MEDTLKLHFYNKMKVVVLDIGSRYTKLGFSGEFNPRYIIPSELIDPTTKSVTRVLDGQDAQQLYNNLTEFLHYIYFRRLLVNPKDTNVVVVESILAPILVRETIAKVLFVHLEVASVLFVPSHMVSLYTLAVPTALSIDLGYLEASVIPVYEGYSVLHAYQAAPSGGKAVENEIRRLLEEYYEKNDPSRLSIVKALSDVVIEDIKVRLCFVAPLEKALREDKDTSRPPDVTYPLPGSPHLIVPGSVREDACEILFRPDIDGVSLPTMVLDAILKCPIDMRKSLAEKLLLFGGTAHLMGLKKRLSQEIIELLKADKYKEKMTETKPLFFNPPSKENYTAWLGGSLLGATDTLSAKAITKEEYRKQGDMPDWANLKYNIKNPDATRSNFSSRIL